MMDKDLLLDNDLAKRLYLSIKDTPICDYHCHLSTKEIFENKRFYNLTQLWLYSDHYKWRLMRQFGINEYFITGKASDYEKFCEFAKCLPSFIGNPIYTWTHMELKKYFDIDIEINENNANLIWNTTCEMMKQNCYTASKFIEGSNVKCVITTDDPIDDLSYHKKLVEKYDFLVLPTFRFDRLLDISNENFLDYILTLSKKYDCKVDSYDSLLILIQRILDNYVAHGCVIADVSMDRLPRRLASRQEVKDLFLNTLTGQGASVEKVESYRYHTLFEICKLLSKNNIALQLHLGVLRNQNTIAFKNSGVDSGYDSIGSCVDIFSFNRLFDELEEYDSVPKTIVYTLNQSDYYPLATSLYNFSKNIKGKMQLGASWWFLDSYYGIKKQLEVLSNIGGLGLFVGMLTDSRSFTSYVRHDYFRRILCNFVSKLAISGQCHDNDQLYNIVKDICFKNIVNYLDLEKVL